MADRDDEDRPRRSSARSGERPKRRTGDADEPRKARASRDGGTRTERDRRAERDRRTERAGRTGERRREARRQEEADDEGRQEAQEAGADSSSGSSGHDGQGRGPSAPSIASSALEFLAMTGREPEGITGLSRTDDGWSVEVEVLELARTPSTTDLLATYEIDLDTEGGFVGYRRSRRYVRGASSS